jgi:UDP-2-acetamido-2,6-beta-L-arabino-hexul-4-ose reductase
MNIVVTGSQGFIGSNLCLRLAEQGHHQVLGITEDSLPGEIDLALAGAEFVFHLAGVNRPVDAAEFITGNVDFTGRICAGLAASGRRAPIVFTSSIQADLDNPYGNSKRAAEARLEQHSRATGAPVHGFRLPNVFGKWSRPHYNSAVATFCHQIARGLPISIHDPAAKLSLVYIDDVLAAFLALLADPGQPGGAHEVSPVYATTVGEVADLIRAFEASRRTLVSERVGTGLTRALYATYLSFLPPADFAYSVATHKDPRGEFVEMLRTPDCGQFSYFTAGPAVTRGEHYHHSKTEKFLVLRGTARFGFRHMASGETCSLEVRGGEGRIVETAPGWTHNVCNIGDDELIVMLWANERFDPARPDTTFMKVNP